MNISIVILLILVFQNTLHSQIVTFPKYSFEKVSFGTGLKEFKPIDTWIVHNNAKLDAMMTKYSNEMIHKVFVDTAISKEAIIRLLFSKTDSTLSSVQFSIENDRYEQKSTEVDRIQILWNEIVHRFGKSFEERSIPMFGIVRKWKLDNCTIVGILSDGSTKSLVLTYSKK